MSAVSIDISEVRTDLLRYWKDADYRSYDLCDIDNLMLVLFLKQRLPSKIARRLINEISAKVRAYIPSATRKICGVTKQRFAQSDSYFLRAMLRLDDSKSLNDGEIQNLRARIISDFQERGSYGGWGQPYDWYSKKLIPKNTVRATVTSQVIKALVELYTSRQDYEALRYAIMAGRFLCYDFPISEDSESELCLAYTEIDQLKVYNANMMVAGSLSMLYNATADQLYLRTAKRLLNYTCRRQRDDGSWTYFSDDTAPAKIDNYHTGYVLENLAICEHYLESEFEWSHAAGKGFDYYVHELFKPGYVPKLSLTRPDILDSHVIAQSMIVFKYFSHMKAYEAVFQGAMPDLYDEQGHMYFRKKGTFVDKTPYVRWGDSWMAFALSLDEKLYI